MRTKPETIGAAGAEMVPPGEGKDAKIRNYGRQGFLVLLVAGLLVISAACSGNVTAQDIQGLLQAVQGKEMVIRLDDGTLLATEIETAPSEAELRGRVAEGETETEAGDDKGGGSVPG